MTEPIPFGHDAHTGLMPVRLEFLTLSGDGLPSRQPLCAGIREQGLNFILVCQPDSHKTLYECVDGLPRIGGVQTLTRQHHRGRKTHTYGSAGGKRNVLEITIGELAKEHLVAQGTAWRVDAIGLTVQTLERDCGVEEY